MLSLLQNARCLKLVTACRIKATLINFTEKRGNFWLYTCIGEKRKWEENGKYNFLNNPIKATILNLKKKKYLPFDIHIVLAS